jgi:hypothetical protein
VAGIGLTIIVLVHKKLWDKIKIIVYYWDANFASHCTIPSSGETWSVLVGVYVPHYRGGSLGSRSIIIMIFAYKFISNLHRVDEIASSKYHALMQWTIPPAHHQGLKGLKSLQPLRIYSLN